MGRTRERMIRMAAMVVTGAMGAAAMGQSELVEVLRVYDARDLMAKESLGQIIRLTPEMVFDSSNQGTGVLELTPRLESVEAGDILLEFAGVSGLTATRLREGIYVATGSPEAHEQLESALKAYRGVGGKRYIVSIEAMQVVSERVPVPGEPAPAPGGELLLRSSQTVNAQTESVVQATRTEQYVSGWVPVVGTQAVGYQVQFATAEDGFVGTLIVASPEGAEDRVSIQVAGWLLDSDVMQGKVTLGGDELPLGTVSRQERGIQTAIVAPIGQRVVLAAVNGFEPETTIILTGSAVLAPNE